MAFIRRIKKKSGTYLAKVESYRENGKIKQRVIKYLGKEIDQKPVRRVSTCDLELTTVKQSLDVAVIHHLAKKLGLADIENPYWLVLAYSHLLENWSISKLAQWVQHTEIPDILGLENVSSLKLYDSLHALSDIDFKKIEQNIYTTVARLEKEKKAAVIDVTDTYFEGQSLSIQRRKGKEGKVRKLIQIGLAVTRKYGFPIMHECYEGNLSNICIFKDLALRLKERGFTSIVMDRGMLSPSNLNALLALDYKTIAGLKKDPSFIKTFIANITKDDIYNLKHRVKLKNTSVYIKSFPYMNGILIVTYNPKTEYTRKEQTYDKGEETKNDRYVGFSLIYHNTDLEGAEVVKQYYDKDIIERAFKQLKGVLNIRPVRVWLKENIKSHIKICYLSYAILSYLGYKTRNIMSPVEALETLKYGYRATITDKKNNHQWQLSVPLKPKQQRILDAVECSV